MTKVNQVRLTYALSELDWSGNTELEYDPIKVQIVRGKKNERRGKPHTVTIHNGDGTATVRYFNGEGHLLSEVHDVQIVDRTSNESHES